MSNGYRNDRYERVEKKGLLDDLDVSDEINACSIVIPVEIDGKKRIGS